MLKTKFKKIMQSHAFWERHASLKQLQIHGRLKATLGEAARPLV
jgi:hypothetical protein